MTDDLDLCDPWTEIVFGIAVEPEVFAKHCTHCIEGAELPHRHDWHPARASEGEIEKFVHAAAKDKTA